MIIRIDSLATIYLIREKILFSWDETWTGIMGQLRTKKLSLKNLKVSVAIIDVFMNLKLSSDNCRPQKD